MDVVFTHNIHFFIMLLSGPQLIIMDKNKLLLLFDVDENLVTHFNIEFKDAHYYVHLVFKHMASCCPKCGGIHIHKKGTFKRTLVANPMNGFPTKLVCTAHRYHCQYCGITFSDRLPMAMDGWNLTRAAIIKILDDLKPYNATYSSIARSYGISVTKVVDIFDAFVDIKRKPLPRILLVDEFYFSRKKYYKYPAVLMNFENNLIIDIIESRKYEKLVDYLYSIKKEERNRVEYICIDMSYTFRPIMKEFFPNATLLVDHFHVCRLVNDQLNNTRKRIMRKYSKNKDSMEYKLLKYRYKKLLKKREDIDYQEFYYDKILQHHVCENAVLDKLLSIDDELEKAYRAKELFMNFDSLTREETGQYDIRKLLSDVIKEFENTNVEEFIEAAGTLKNWKNEIIESFVWIGTRRISNGPIEGKNNYIKKIISNANGMMNFERARNRIIYSQNKYETYKINS